MFRLAGVLLAWHRQTNSQICIDGPAPPDMVLHNWQRFRSLCVGLRIAWGKGLWVGWRAGGGLRRAEGVRQKWKLQFTFVHKRPCDWTIHIQWVLLFLVLRTSIDNIVISHKQLLEWVPGDATHVVGPQVCSLSVHWRFPRGLANGNASGRQIDATTNQSKDTCGEVHIHLTKTFTKGKAQQHICLTNKSSKYSCLFFF